MTKVKKPRRIVRAQKRAIAKNPRASYIMKVMKAAGQFRWERIPSKSEWIMDIVTHGIGIGLAIAALPILVTFSWAHGNMWALVSTSIFAATMISLYMASTFAHAMIGQKSELGFEVWDNIAIYGLIAGTYTPFLLVNMPPHVGWPMFILLWSLAIFGGYVKIRNPRRQPRWMPLIYLAMGWALLLVLPWVIYVMSERALWLMLAGGLSYSIGILFYVWRKLKYSHMIWHLFVLAGSIFFFFAVLFGSIIDFVP